MGNQLTKAQIRKWLDDAVKEAKNPDMRKVLKDKRRQKKKTIAKGYGLKS